MSDPIFNSMGEYFSLNKIGGIFAGICGSIIPILALADKKEIKLVTASLMAFTGSSFSIFVGPYLSQKLGIVSLDAIIALSWVMGAIGVFVVRSVIEWFEKYSVNIINSILQKFLGKDTNDINIPDR